LFVHLVDCFMLKRLFSSQKSKRRSAPPRCNRPTYAIGDIHGRLDLLEPLVDLIRKDIAADTLGSERPLLVFLGDYIDRGPASRGVVDHIIRLRADPCLEVKALKGNHEEALLLFLQDAEFGRIWINHGGANTLSSYQIQPPNARSPVEDFEKARTALRDAMGPNHFRFFRELELYLQQDDYLFVHAGVRWGVPIEKQVEQDLLWIRKDFLEVDEAMDYVIVHGHTPAERPFLGGGRIGIDTGAYATGVLTAVRLWKESQKVIQSS
jgi:serine/threonine protein phosphatase 1